MNIRTITKVRKDWQGVITECWIDELNVSINKDTIVGWVNDRNYTVRSQDPSGNRAFVEVFRVEHITTKPDNLTSNNLDNLPTY